LLDDAFEEINKNTESGTGIIINLDDIPIIDK